MTEAMGTQSLEVPVVLDCIDQDGETTLFRFAFEGKPYEMSGPRRTETEFTEWLPGYAAATPRCADCERVIFPGEPVTIGHAEPEDSGHWHFPKCNDTAAGFAGAFNSDGQLVSAWNK